MVPLRYWQLLLAFLLPSGVSYSQKKLELTRISDNKIILLHDGERVGYFRQGVRRIKCGNLAQISDSSFRIDSEVIRLPELAAIGRRKYGTAGRMILLSVGAGFCFGWFGLSSNYSAPVRIGGLVAAGLTLGYGINIMLKNSPKRIGKRWRLQVVQ